LPEVAAAPQEAVDALTAAGAQVMPLFAGSNLLQVSFAHRGEPAGDADLALLAGVADQVYALNLADAKPTDAGLAPLAAMKNLSALHLERSAVTDAGLAHFAGLERLEYLNLFGTSISDAGLTHLAALKHLRRLYLWQTKASYDAAKKQADEAKAELAKAEQQLEGAKKNAEAVNARLAEVEKQLKALEAPPAEADENKAQPPQAAEPSEATEGANAQAAN
jgi:hypothetical protein